MTWDIRWLENTLFIQFHNENGIEIHLQFVLCNVIFRGCFFLFFFCFVVILHFYFVFFVSSCLWLCAFAYLLWLRLHIQSIQHESHFALVIFSVFILYKRNLYNSVPSFISFCFLHLPFLFGWIHWKHFVVGHTDVMNIFKSDYFPMRTQQFFLLLLVLICFFQLCSLCMPVRVVCCCWLCAAFCFRIQIYKFLL